MRIVVLAAMVLTIGAVVVPFAIAQAADGDGSNSLLTADLTTVTGTRSVSAATTTTLIGALSGTINGTYSTTVTETARTGVASWTVSGRVCGPNNLTTPTAPDCTTYPDRLVNVADSTKQVLGTAISIFSRAATQTAGGGTATGTSGTQDVSTTRALFTTAGQSTSAVYTGTYTGTGSLSITPVNGQSSGTYKGYFVVTLAQ